MITKASLRRFAISSSLFKPTSLKKAMDKLGFVQADPIRSPARAQDLILRHRVIDYHVGDLDTNYSRLDLEEDFLYAYGFYSPNLRALLHPKNKVILSDFEKKVLAFVQKKETVHPRDLQTDFGKKTQRNWWGGNSNKSKLALDHLHYHGFLRIAGREKGIRTYEPVKSLIQPISELERIQQLTLVIVSLLQPVTEISFRQALNYLRYFFFDRKKYTSKYILELMLKNKLLVREKIENISYIWKPSGFKTQTVSQEVKFLAPFDPVVWDRTRFEHLWGWPYRFEAYVPAAKRIRGYYSLPLLWKDGIIGWVNAQKDGSVDIGYVEKKPDDRKFDEELEKEVNRFKKFLLA